MFNAFLSGFEFGTVVFFSLHFIAYAWHRSLTVKQPQINSIEWLESLDIPDPVFPSTEEVHPAIAWGDSEGLSLTVAKSIPSVSTVVYSDEDLSYQELYDQAKELGIKGLNPHWKIETLRRKIKEVKG